MAEPVGLEVSAPPPPANLDPALRIKLSIMMFLQYAIWGAWAPILALHLQQLDDFKNPTELLGLTLAQDTKINLIYMTMAIASILSPFLAGQIADRYFSTERFLAFSQLVGGILLLTMSRLVTFPSVFVAMLAYTLIYAPTVALTNSLSFHHLPNGEKDFGGIRLWGTLGWIAVGWAFGFYLRATGANVGLCLTIAGVISLVMAGYSFALPHTPPPENPTDPWAFMAALRLMKNRSFAILVIVSFLVSTELQFYYVLTPAFFNQGGGPYDAKALAGILVGNAKTTPADMAAATELIAAGDRDGNKKLSLHELEDLAPERADARRILDVEQAIVQDNGGVRLAEGTVPIIMTLGQICETLILLLLPLFLKRLGFRTVIAIGIAAWSIRYFIFAWSPSPSLVIASQTLHGFGFSFFFVGGFIYGNRIAGKDIKASAQALLLLVTYGFGMLVSSLIAGPISDYFQRDWHTIFLVPALLTAVCTVLFLVGFREEMKPAPVTN